MELTPMTDNDTRAKAREAEREHAEHVRAELRRLQLKLLQANEAVIDSVTAQHAAPSAPVDTERRIAANALGMHEWCARAKCRRAHACIGEPLECLRVGLLETPPDALERFVNARRRPKRR